MVINPHHHIERTLLDWSCDDDFFYPPVEKRLELLRRKELARGLNDDVDPVLIPGHLPRRRVFAETDPLAVHHHCVRFMSDFARPAAMYRIELQQMSGAFSTPLDFIDMNDVELGPIPGRAQSQSPHAAKSVDTDADAHKNYSPCQK